MSSKNTQRPNILFILTDDQGPWAMNCAGNEEIITPNLDKLAETGTRFENFFCTSPVCSPARASILTGKIPSQHGVQDFIKDNSQSYLPEDSISYTDVLHEAGYKCGLSGKWHLGDSLTPQSSFTHWYAHAKGSGHYYNAPMIRNGKEEKEPDYITDAITDDAINFLERSAQDDEPFYLSVHYTAPHDPWTVDEHPQELLDLYKDCDFNTCPQDFVHPDAVYQYEKKYIRECLMGYFAAVTGVDRGVGRLVETLEKLRLRDNTLVIFTSDNGFNCGHHGVWGKGNATFSLNMYDTSIKVPTIFNHPGKVPPGKVIDDLLSQYDFMPTLLDYTGLETPNIEQLPGKSFLDILQERQSDTRENVVVYDEYGPVRMIRSKDWKYIHRYPYGPHELYNLVDDPDESVNLYNLDEYESVVLSMRHSLDNWFNKYVVPEMDGVKQPVRGNGQVDKVNSKPKGKFAFDQNRTVQHSPIPPTIQEEKGHLRK